jgi:hypothetical protein
MIQGSDVLEFLLVVERILGVFAVPVILILIGGICVLSDVVLLKRRGDSEGISSFLGTGSRPRPGLRLASVFFFTLASILAARGLLTLPSLSNPGWSAIAIGIAATALSFLILLCGILLPRALGEVFHDALPVRALAKFARWLTIWIDPLAELGWSCVSAFLRLLGVDPKRPPSRARRRCSRSSTRDLSLGPLTGSRRRWSRGCSILTSSRPPNS